MTTLHPTLGRDLKEVSLTELVSTFPRMTRARVYRMVKNDPTIEGFVYCTTLMLGEKQVQSMIPFGPHRDTKTWHDLEGKAVGSRETALTNPMWPTQYAYLPEGFPRNQLKELDDLIAAEEKAGLEELPRVWTGRKDNGMRMEDRLRNPETGEELIVLTFGGKRLNEVDLRHVLTCPALAYSTEIETDPASPDYEYSKGHSQWAWMSLGEARQKGYTILLASGSLEPYAFLVATKDEERGIE